MLYNVKLISNIYTSIEDKAKAGSESEGEPTLSKHLQQAIVRFHKRQQLHAITWCFNDSSGHVTLAK